MFSIEIRRHLFILLVSVFLSFGCIVYCAFWGKTDDGGRGGAVAVAISFISLFSNRPHGTYVFDLLMKDRDKFLRDLDALRKSPTHEKEAHQKRVDRSIEALTLRIEIDATGQDRLNMFMSISAGIGTLAWGFGDYASFWLQKLLYCSS